MNPRRAAAAAASLSAGATLAFAGPGLADAGWLDPKTLKDLSATAVIYLMIIVGFVYFLRWLLPAIIKAQTDSFNRLSQALDAHEEKLEQFVSQIMKSNEAMRRELEANTRTLAELARAIQLQSALLLKLGGEGMKEALELLGTAKEGFVKGGR